MTVTYLWRGWLVGAWLAGAAVITVSTRPAGNRAELPTARLAAPDTSDSLLVSDSVYQGWKWFHVYCFRCHGEDAVGGINPSAPDLRWVLSSAGKAYPRDSFEAVVLNGRIDRGMPAWKVLLDTSSVRALYLYTKARSDGWLKPGRPHRASDLKKSE